MEISIESIADHLDLVRLVGRWHWEEWGQTDPGGSLERWTESLARRAGRDTIPTTLLAFTNGDPAGSASLVEHDMSVHLDLTPWLAGVYVVPECRGLGIASALVRAAVALAGSLGAPNLYLYTEVASGLYERLGWQEVAREQYEGREVTIMKTGASAPL